jgi:hypothetical protein
MNSSKPGIVPSGALTDSSCVGGIRAEAIEGLLTCLLGREVKAHRQSRPRQAPLNSPTSGIYRDDSGQSRAVFSCDIGLAASAAAALTLIPPGVASEAIAAKVLTDMLRENLGEILNVCAQLLNEIYEYHVVLREVCTGHRLPPDAVDESNRHGLDFDVTVRGYGGGRLLVLTRLEVEHIKVPNRR